MSSLLIRWSSLSDEWCFNATAQKKRLSASHHVPSSVQIQGVVCVIMCFIRQGSLLKMSVPNAFVCWISDPSVSNHLCCCFQPQWYHLGRWTCRHICLQLPPSYWLVNLLTKRSRKCSVCQWLYFWPCWMRTSLVQYVKCISAVGVACCHPKCRRRWRDVDVVDEGTGLRRRRGGSYSWTGAVTLCQASWGAATDVGINTRTTVPAVSTLESRRSVTGVSVTQALKRAIRCWVVCLQTQCESTWSELFSCPWRTSCFMNSSMAS